MHIKLWTEKRGVFVGSKGPAAMLLAGERRVSRESLPTAKNKGGSAFTVQSKTELKIEVKILLIGTRYQLSKRVNSQMWGEVS